MYQTYLNSKHFRESAWLRYSNNLRIGILGGSFSPAHEGHLHLTLNAIKHLKLNFVVWLITPLNPIKANIANNILSLDQRIKYAKLIINNHPKIKISIFEESFSLYYTYITLRVLETLNKYNNQIYFLMGEDNLANFDKFLNWMTLLKNNNVASFTRGDKSYTSLNQKWSIYSKMLCNNFINYKFNKYEKDSKGNLYYYLIPHVKQSSTEIRMLMNNKIYEDK